MRRKSSYFFNRQIYVSERQGAPALADNETSKIACASPFIILSRIGQINDGVFPPSNQPNQRHTKRCTFSRNKLKMFLNSSALKYYVIWKNSYMKVINVQIIYFFKIKKKKEQWHIYIRVIKTMKSTVTRNKLFVGKEKCQSWRGLHCDF